MTEKEFFEAFEHERWDLTYADEHRDDQTVLQVGIVASFYLEDAYLPERRKKIAEAFELYCQKYGSNLVFGYMGSEELVAYDFTPATKQKCMAYVLADGYSDASFFMWSSARGGDVVGDFVFQALLPAGWFERVHHSLSAIRFYLPVEALRDNSPTFESFMKTLCDLLEPLHGCAGLGIQNSHEHQNYQHTEYEILQAYRGVDLSLSIANESWRGGYVGLNWYTYLSAKLMQKVSQGQLAAIVNDTRFKLIPYKTGTLIRAGEWPALGKINVDPQPELYVKLNEVIKPARVADSGSLHYGSVAGETRLNIRTSNLWLRRFDLPPGQAVPETPLRFRRLSAQEREKVERDRQTLDDFLNSSPSPKY